MKKKIYYFFTIFLFLFINISFVFAIECNYSPIASFDEYGNYTGPLPDYTLPEDLKWLVEQGNYIKLTSYNSGKGKEGGKETLKNWDNKKYCPNFIRTTYNFWECFLCDGDEWYGYDDLESAKKNGIDYDTIYIYDKHLKELKEGSEEYDHKVSYTCKYGGEHYFSIDFNKDGYALSAKSTMETTSTSVFFAEYDLSEKMKTTKPIKVGECENVHVCLSNTISGQQVFNYYTIFADELDYEENKSECKENLFIGEIHDGTSDFTDGCRTYYQYKEEMEMYWNNCKNNRSFCNDYRNKKNKLLGLCGAITKYASYEKSDCLKACLKIKEHINGIEQTTSEIQVCGLSEKLILWIANIIRWVKYIIPVAVIVLGILDFMKAIGADKEDEMKKAQQRFIKRLIAAALIFIIPFIIEFVLNKMGFNSNGCGIINL